MEHPPPCHLDPELGGVMEVDSRMDALKGAKGLNNLQPETTVPWPDFADRPPPDPLAGTMMESHAWRWPGRSNTDEGLSNDETDPEQRERLAYVTLVASFDGLLGYRLSGAERAKGVRPAAA